MLYINAIAMQVIRMCNLYSVCFATDGVSSLLAASINGLPRGTLLAYMLMRILIFRSDESHLNMVKVYLHELCYFAQLIILLRTLGEQLLQSASIL